MDNPSENAAVKVVKGQISFHRAREEWARRKDLFAFGKFDQAELDRTAAFHKQQADELVAALKELTDGDAP